MCCCLSPKHLGAFIIQLLITALPFCTGHNTYYVKTTPDTPCHKDPCHTLSKYVNEAKEYFTSNTTMIFLRGQHDLQSHVRVKNIVGFVLKHSSNSLPQIVCDHNTFTFENLSSLEITGLSFTSCRLHLNNSNALFQDISLEDSMAHYGGAMYAHHSVINFGQQTRLVGNTAVVAGGGIFANKSSLRFQKNTTFINNYAGSGGALFVIQSYMSFHGNICFIGNSVAEPLSNIFLEYSGAFDNVFTRKGGAIHANSTTMTFEGDTMFKDNAAVSSGGGIFARESNLTFHGNTTFINNSVDTAGGGFYMTNSIVSFNGNTSFVYNAVQYYGGGVFMVNSTVNFFGTNNFAQNFAWLHGGGVNMLESTMSFDGNNTFGYNSANFSGGGLAAYTSSIQLSGSSNFTHNSAHYGGGIKTQNSTLNIIGICSFIYNTAQEEGGGIVIEDTSTLSIDGESYFNGNSALYFGGGLVSHQSTVEIFGNSYVINNSGMYGGGIYAERCNISWSWMAKFLDNSVIHNGYNNGHGGAIHALSSSLTFRGTLVFTNNSAGYGGAIALSGFDQSKMYVLISTIMTFIGNFALHHGGALHVEDNPFIYCIFDNDIKSKLQEACFIQILQYELTCDTHVSFQYDYGIQLWMQDNIANEAGNVLYGGNLDTCRVCIHSWEYVTGTVAFHAFSNISTEIASGSDITSDPYRVCVCEDNHPHCNEAVITHEVYPGGTIHIPVAAVGQQNGTSPTVIRSDLEGLKIANLQNAQTTNKTCSLLQYTVYTTGPGNVDNHSIILYADEPCSRSGFPLKVKVKFRSCPNGFSLSSRGRCTCEERLQRYTTECNINDQSIQRHREFWLGFDNHLAGLILHPHCPFDYCKMETIDVTLNDSDVQCDHNRSGILCGACQQHLSLTLGSSRCLPCSNTFLALIAPFALAGFALVTFLFICRVTIAAGTMSGLIFYANIVVVNKTLFFSSGETNILTVFIAWLSLDLGIETCFFDGMNVYYRTWLQFVFPIYIWLLVGLITVLSNVSITFTKIMGSANPVAILATLFLLSYTKLLRTIVTAFSFTTLEYPEDETKVAWLYDGNIGYFDKNDGMHLTLLLFSLLVFLFLFLPYTLFLLFGQCILPKVNLNKLRWLSQGNYLRMKSFSDAYHAPYKDRHRYWTGLLLVLRFILLLISAIVDIKSPQDTHVNLLVIISSTFLLAIFAWNASGGVYKKWYLNALESSFILNLAILSAATYQVRVAGGNQTAVFCTSVTIAIATFIGIITYHICLVAMDTRAWRNYMFHREQEQERARNLAHQNRNELQPRVVLPTESSINLRELLLSS